MKQFLYRARSPEGEIVNGTIESLTAEQAAKTLQERKFLVVNLNEKRAISLQKILHGEIFSSISERELANFTRLLSTMLSTGLPLTDALSNLIVQTKNNALRETLQSILHDVQSGMTLSESMSHSGNAFSDMYINLVRAGEASGKVDESLSRLADTMETSMDFKSKVSGAMVYPIVILVAMTGISIFMITTIIPKIADVYKEYGAELPIVTRALVKVADLFSNYFLIVILVGALLFFLYKTLRRNPTSDYLINNVMFKFPVFGEISQETTMALICLTFSVLLASGVAILDAIKIVAKAVSNNYYRSGLLETGLYVEKGLPLSLALRRNPHFPLMVSQLIAIGEETGTIDKSLERLAKFYQDAAERKVKIMTTLLEPMMLILMGLMVGGLAIAILMPMFGLSSVIK